MAELRDKQMREIAKGEAEGTKKALNEITKALRLNLGKSIVNSKNLIFYLNSFPGRSDLKEFLKESGKQIDTQSILKKLKEDNDKLNEIYEYYNGVFLVVVKHEFDKI
jgi:hypothetical protein